MKLASLPRRSYRRPARQQRAHSLTGETDAPAFFSASRQSEARFKVDPFFSPRPRLDDHAQAQAEVKEEDKPKPKMEEEEPVKTRQDVLAQAPEKEQEVKPRADELRKAPEEEKDVKPKCECGGSCGSCSKEEPKQPMAKKESGAATPTSAKSPCCSGAQQGAIDSAVSGAAQLAQRAMTAVHAARRAAEDPTGGSSEDALNRYERWFGAYDPVRAAIVEEVYRRIRSDLTGQEIQFDCDCQRNWYAYVCKRGGTLNISLCRLFWTKAGGSGLNSRPGTLVHEMAHHASGAVVDHGYGVGKAQALAKANPAVALSNAENYSCFSEAL